MATGGRSNQICSHLEFDWNQFNFEKSYKVEEICKCNFMSQNSSNSNLICLSKVKIDRAKGIFLNTYIEEYLWNIPGPSKPFYILDKFLCCIELETFGFCYGWIGFALGIITASYTSLRWLYYFVEGSERRT